MRWEKEEVVEDGKYEDANRNSHLRQLRWFFLALGLLFIVLGVVSSWEFIPRRLSLAGIGLAYLMFFGAGTAVIPHPRMSQAIKLLALIVGVVSGIALFITGWAALVG